LYTREVSKIDALLEELVGGELTPTTALVDASKMY
jgi:hypothetical protein